MKAFETPLCELAYKYGTDKCPQIKHNYTPFYYKLLKDKQKSIKKVLEIGLGTEYVWQKYPTRIDGASLYLWRDFFPNAQIFGADILTELVFKDGRIETFQCDQSKIEDLKNLIQKTGSDIDLFVDDGSHIPNDQVLTCLTLMPMLKKDVIYIIEDVADPTIAQNFKDYNCYSPTIRDSKYYSDDALLVITNK